MTRVGYTGSDYRIDVRNVIKNRNLEFKFDTGAVSTFVTIGALIRNDNEKIKANVKRAFEYYEGIGKTKSVFHSASNTEMPVFKVYAENVMVGDIEMPFFYYWLSPVHDYKRLLLGDDFVKYCEFYHLPDEDIFIKDFKIDNYINYNRNEKRSDCISQNEILEMINSEQ